MSTRPRRSDAERAAAWRARQRRGERIYRVLVNEDTFAALDRAGLLRAGEVDDPDAIETALTVALQDWADEKIRHM